MKKRKVRLAVVLVVIVSTLSLAFLSGCNARFYDFLLGGRFSSEATWVVVDVEGSSAPIAESSITFRKTSFDERTYLVNNLGMLGLSGSGDPIWDWRPGWSVEGEYIRFGPRVFGTFRTFTRRASRSGDNLILSYRNVIVTFSRV